MDGTQDEVRLFVNSTFVVVVVGMFVSVRPYMFPYLF
jgi:hypothetical protein